MSHAIIVVGNEYRFLEASRSFARYLHHGAGCERISLIRSAYLQPDELAARLRKAVRRASGQSLLVAYFGHGQKDGWSYGLKSTSYYQRFAFKELVPILSAHGGPLAIVNDTCHADGLKPHLEKAGLTDRCLLISACATEDVAYGDLGKAVFEQWRQGIVFEPVVHEETLCIIDEWRYKPPTYKRILLWLRNAKIAILNRFISAKRRRPQILCIFGAPNGWGVSEEISRRTVGLRSGPVLDHHFFPKPA